MSNTFATPLLDSFRCDFECEKFWSVYKEAMYT